MRSVRQCGRHHVFKPASVQALWTAIQTLHLISARLKVTLVAGSVAEPGCLSRIRNFPSRIQGR
jgi:hypothetical protein